MRRASFVQKEPVACGRSQAAGSSQREIPAPDAVARDAVGGFLFEKEYGRDAAGEKAGDSSRGDRGGEARMVDQPRAGSKRSAGEESPVADGFYRLGLVRLVHHARQGSFFETGIQRIREQESRAARTGISEDETEAAGSNCPE